MILALLCILLIGHHVHAVVNKATSNVPLVKENEKSTKVNADDRISNTFTSLSDEYGPPLGFGFNGPAPVYGPPELVGNLGPTPIYPPPPAEVPPPVFGSPAATYGPPRGIKPQYGAPKQTFSLASTSLLSKPSYGPPKLHYGPPKQLFAPPASIPPFRLPKPQYGPPLKLVATSSQQYVPPPLASQHGLPKPGHGPPIPVSLETYGPPPPKLPIQFNPLPNDEYGPPPLPVPAPQPQYGPPAGDLYGPPPPAPPPGVPAPPTPPDIKYDGWQPIAGLAASPNQSGGPTNAYGAPNDAKHNHIDGSSSSQLSHAALTVSTNPNVPSDSYGVPIHNPEAQDLKTSVHESSASSESNGLPPPPLPQYEPLHNNQGPGVVPTSGQSDHQLAHQQQQQQQQQHLHGTANIEPLSIVKTVGFELLPANEHLSSLSLSGGTSDVSSLSHISSSVANSLSHHSGLELTSDEGASHAAVLNNDLSLQQPVQQAPSGDYGLPLTTVSFGKQVLSGASLLPPPLLNSYGAPPLSSYSPTGPYPASQGGRGIHSFGLFGGSFHKQNLQFHRPHAGPFRPPSIPLGSLIPPRNRDPIKFKELVPSRLLSNINRYLPPPAKQHLPNLHAPLSFHQTPGSGNLFSFASTSLVNGYHSNSPIAAPHVQYGTPLSFTDFNRPTPHLTYGAPNFGPATSFVSTSSGFGGNLYSGIGNGLTTYGTPVVNAPLSDNGGYECNLNSLQPLLPASGELHLRGSLPSASGELHSTGELHPSGGLSSGGEASSGEKLALVGAGSAAHEDAHSSGKLQIAFENAGSLENHGAVFTNSLAAGTAGRVVDLSDANHQNSIFGGGPLPLVKPLVNFLEGPPVNTLDLQHNEQQKTNLKDSYGNPVGITYDSTNEASNSGAAISASAADAAPADSSAQFSSQFRPDAYSATTSFEHGHSGITAEALTASLTAQGYGQAKNLGSNEVDASQFLNSNEGSEALSLAQRLTAENADGFEIHGSKGTYRLQIQPADGGLGTENSDGSIRHEQVLSDGLLQDILAAIEQPENGPVQLDGQPQAQQLEQVLGPDLRSPGLAHVSNGHFITVNGDQARSSGPAYDQVQQASDRKEGEKYAGNPSVALFFDTRYGESKKKIRSVPKSEAQTKRGRAEESERDS